MCTSTRLAVLLGAALSCATATARAQDSVPSFDMLVGRIHVGERVWVTDSAGREVRGSVARLSSDQLVLKGDGLRTFAASEIRRVRQREHDSVKNGALIGLGIGAGIGAAWCIAAVADDSPRVNARVECGEGFTAFPAISTLIGVAVDALRPGPLRVVYQAASPRADSRLMIVPWVAARVKGLALVVALP